MNLTAMSRNTTAVSNSATDALLWLKRALEFIHALIVQIINGQSSLSDSAVNAYKLTLSKYHGWVVRGIFNLAMKSVPYREDFFIALGPGNEDMVIMLIWRYCADICRF